MRPLIVATALEHHLVSKYTSLVAVDVTPIAPAGTDPLRTAIPGLLPAGLDPAGFVGGLPRTATPAQSLLIVGVALAALAWGEPRRRTYWEQELLNALTIIQRGWSTPTEMIGSWAGAMGHTQWMPEVWLNVGVDFNGDGRTDLAFATAPNTFCAWTYANGFPRKPSFEHTFPENLLGIESPGDIDGTGRTTAVLRTSRALYLLRPTRAQTRE